VSLASMSERACRRRLHRSTRVGGYGAARCLILKRSGREDDLVTWQLSGRYFENCNCDVTCPCAVSGFAVPGDRERCIVLLVFREDGARHSVRIGEFADVEVEDFWPEGADEPTKLTGVPHPVSSTLTAARATRSKVRAFGIELDGVGKNGHAAPFSWTG